MSQPWKQIMPHKNPTEGQGATTRWVTQSWIFWTFSYFSKLFVVQTTPDQVPNSHQCCMCLWLIFKHPFLILTLILCAHLQLEFYLASFGLRYQYLISAIFAGLQHFTDYVFSFAWKAFCRAPSSPPLPLCLPSPNPCPSCFLLS